MRNNQEVLCSTARSFGVSRETAKNISENHTLQILTHLYLIFTGFYNFKREESKTEKISFPK